MYRIMFICTGNICRSPLAHGLMEKLIKDNDLESHFFVESSGTDAWHSGEQVDSRMRETAKRHGVHLDHYSRQLVQSDLSDYDLLLTMDRSHYQKAARKAGNPAKLKRIVMFRDFDPQGPGDVPDPWYGGMAGFEEVWMITERTCHALFKDLRQKVLSNG